MGARLLVWTDSSDLRIDASCVRLNAQVVYTILVAASIYSICKFSICKFRTRRPTSQQYQIVSSFWPHDSTLGNREVTCAKLYCCMLFQSCESEYLEVKFFFWGGGVSSSFLIDRFLASSEERGDPEFIDRLARTSLRSSKYGTS